VKEGRSGVWLEHKGEKRIGGMRRNRSMVTRVLGNGWGEIGVIVINQAMLQSLYFQSQGGSNY
jgi:hypothetical protein